MEGFDHLAQGDLVPHKWDAWSHGISSTGFVAGRIGGGNAWSQIYGDRTLDKIIDAQGTWIVGAAMAFSPINQNGFAIIKLMDGATNQVELRYEFATKKLYVTRNGTTILGPGVVVTKTSLWHYYELRVVISDMVGEVEVRVDGNTYLSGTLLDTRNGGATVDTIRFGDRGNFDGTQILDDIYICDGTGSAPTNTFLGDVKVESIFPSGNGNSSVLVGSDGNSIDNYLLVDESAPNSDTDYVESSTVGDKDTYAYGNLTATLGTVYGVQVLPWAKKTDAGARKIASIARLSGTEVDSADKTLFTDYSYYLDVREAKPGGGVWTITDVNAAEFGVKVTA